jgi:hypothetical protein
VEPGQRLVHPLDETAYDFKNGVAGTDYCVKEVDIARSSSGPGAAGTGATDPYVTIGVNTHNIHRDVYNVVATSQYTGTLKTLVHSTLPHATNSFGDPVVEDYGFKELAYTGSTGVLMGRY